MKINKENVVEAYNVADENGKNMLVDSLSSELIDDNTTNERK